MGQVVKRRRMVLDGPASAPVPCRCTRCGRRLGRYLASQASMMVLDGTAKFSLESTDRGPRSGTGIYLETFEGHDYVRVKCKCGRNDKVRAGNLPLRVAPDVVYL